MKPIVLIGGGENHYRLIHSLPEETVRSRSIILIGDSNKYFSKNFLPLTISGHLTKESSQFDIWSLCQRKNIYFLQDECVNINRDDKVLFLKKYGKISYHYLSVETDCKAFTLVNEVGECPSVFENQKSQDLLIKIKHFLSEVHKHCPKEIRIVFTGLSQNAMDLGYFLNKNLLKSCEKIDLVFIGREASFFEYEKAQSKKVIQKLSESNIRILFSKTFERLSDHKVTFADGSTLDFDIFIPFDDWRSMDSMGRLFQSENSKIYIQRDLSLSLDSSLFFTGPNVLFKNENLSVEEINKEEVIKVLKHNIFHDDKDAPRLTCRNLKLSPLQRPYLIKKSFLSLLTQVKSRVESSEVLKEEALVHLKFLQNIPVLEISKKQLQDKLNYDAHHMSRPWQGFVEKKKENSRYTYRLISSNGFNSWGSYTQSALKVCELAIFKAITQGVKPEYLRFNLTLPKKSIEFDRHVFESTFKAIEEIAENNEIEIDGGDTFDGEHWHLSITIGGESSQRMNQKFSPHDYLIMTRPLGFGSLWANRLHDQFDSQWVETTFKSQLLVSYKHWKNFITEFNPSTSVIIEEWGFLYHCLQSLPSHQQLMINFREVPRWTGIDKVLAQSNTHPGLDQNWERIKEAVAFNKEEVSLNNSILWDSLSQGSVVVGVKAQDYKEALKRIREMGFTKAALVGCIRPKNSNNRIVLSDWSPL